MDLTSLHGRIVQSIYSFECNPVHPAWVNELTTTFATSSAFLEMADGQLIQVYACEVVLDPEDFPSLGLCLDECMNQAMSVVRSWGVTDNATPLAGAIPMLPFKIFRVEQSDPMGEGAISEFRLYNDSSRFILFRHIFPPTTLGIDFGGSQ
jgi:hypothetical protein